MPLSTGQVLNNRYRIVKLLGQGGFGAVYRAWDMQMEGACAVKENLDISPAAQKQFEREAKLLYKLRHSNLPRVFDHFLIPGQGQYLVMDYIEGVDLESHLGEASGPLPESQTLEWIGQICDALTYLHTQNPPIIHRDLKPANIRITPAGQAVLVDFGIAKAFDPGLKTTTGARAVTPGFAPHEQYGLGKTDARTDLYALGATLYNCLTGERPVESIQRAITDGLPPPEQLNPGLSPHISTAIRRAMAMDPARRFQSAAELKRELTMSGYAEETRIARVASTAAAPTAAAPSAGGHLPERKGVTRPGALPSLPRWGVLGAAGFIGVVMVGVLAVIITAVYLISKAEGGSDQPTTTAIHTTQTGETLEARATQPPARTEGAGTTQTAVDYATSTILSPAELPADIPVMPGASNLQVFQTNQGQSGTMVSVSFTIQETDDAIIAYYEREMPADGWKQTGTFSDANNRIVYYQKGERVAMLIISQTTTPRMVTISIVGQ